MTLHLPTEGLHEGTGAQFQNAGLEDETGASSSGTPLDEIRNGIKVFLDLGITIGKQVEEQTRATNRLLNRLERNTPVDSSLIASGVFPATGNLVLNLGGADQGTFWEVESVAVGGTDQNVSAAGTAGLYVSGFVPGPTSSPGMTALADQAKSLPNTGFYGGRDIVVNDGEYLFLIIFGGTVGQTYVANAQCTVFNVAAALGQVEAVS